MLKISYSTKARKDLKSLSKNKGAIATFKHVVTLLCEQKKIPPKLRDHKLSGNYKRSRELHLKPDLLMIYEIDKPNKILHIFRVGSHTKLFKKL